MQDGENPATQALLAQRKITIQAEFGRQITPLLQASLVGIPQKTIREGTFPTAVFKAPITKVRYEGDADWQTPGISCSDDFQANFDDIYLMSDVHGHLELFNAMKVATGVEGDLRSAFIGQGDYVDRGPDSLGTLAAFLGFQRTYPNRVILLRGDHESLSIIPYTKNALGTEDFLMKNISVEQGKLLQSRLPIAVKIGKEVLVVHGGISAPKVEKPDPLKDEGEDSLWSGGDVRRGYCYWPDGTKKSPKEMIDWQNYFDSAIVDGKEVRKREALQEEHKEAEIVTPAILAEQAKKLGFKYVFVGHSHQNLIYTDGNTGVTIVTTTSSKGREQLVPVITRYSPKERRIIQYYFSDGVLSIDTPQSVKSAWLVASAGEQRSTSFGDLDQLLQQPLLSPKKVVDIIYEMLDSGEFFSLNSKRQEAVIALEKEMYFYLNGTQRRELKEKSEQLHRVATASMISEWKAESVSQDKQRLVSFLKVDGLLEELNEASIPGWVSMRKLDVLYAIYDMIEKEKGIVWTSLDPRKQTALIALEKNIYSSLGDTGRRLIEDRRPKALIAALREIYIICEGLKWHSLKRGKQAALAALEKHLYDSLSPEQRQQISAARSTSIQKLNHAEWREDSRVQHRHRPGSFKKLDRLLSESQPDDLKVLEKIYAIKADKSFSSMHLKRRAALEALEQNVCATCDSVKILKGVYALQQSSEWRSFKPERQAVLITLEKKLYDSLFDAQKQGMKAERSFCQEKIHDTDTVHQWRKNSSSWMRIRPKSFEALDELLETLSQSQIHSISQHRMDVLHYLYDHVFPQADYRHSAEWAALNSKRRNVVIELEQNIYRSLTDDQRQGIDPNRNTVLSRIQRASLVVKASAGIVGDEPAAPGEDVTDPRRMRRR